MATSAINSSSNINPLTNLDAQSRMPVTTLDQNDFLKLLVTQMTTQDPMKPMEDLSSFSQLASFSALEQNKATQASMAMIQANSMLGNYVQVTDDLGKSMVGQVQQVLMIDGEPQLVVDGERYTLDKVGAISTSPFSIDPGTQTATPPATTTTSTTPPPPTTTPQLGTAPKLGVDPTLGTAPILINDPTTGGAPVLVNPAVLGLAPRI
jgi:flagellar basal-body rod modification protein FlgD